MKIGLSLLVAALALAAVALLAGNRVGSIAPTHVEESRDEPTSLAASAPREVRREEVASPAETGATAAAAEPGHPWLARMRVVDENREPVADAVITLWDGPTKGSAAERAEWRRTHPGFLELRSDREGRASAMVEREGALAVAEKENVGRSADVWIVRASEASETTFILLVPVTIRGIVRNADGSPAVGAIVRATGRGGQTAGLTGWTYGMSPEPPPVVTDAVGRFAMSVGRYGRYRFCASLGEMRTFVQAVSACADEPPEIELVFPGAFTIRGVVVDAEGAPVTGAFALAWPGTESDRLMDVDLTRQTTDASGAFSMDVSRPGSYRIFAGAAGHAASEIAVAEITPTQPAATVRLALQRYAEIRGHVVHGDGTAFADVEVHAAPELETAATFARVEASRLRDARTRSDAAGAFVLRVHPSTTWIVSAHPLRSSDIHVQERGVASGRADVVLRVSDADLAGCIVRGTAVQPDGSQARDYAVEIVVYRDGKPVTYRDARAVIDGDRFVCAPVPRHEVFGVQVISSADRERWPKNSGPFAPAFLGPLTAEAEHVDVTMRFAEWGQLPVRVLEHDGRAARGVHVWFEPEQNPNAGVSMPVAFDGCITLQRVAPGPGMFHVVRPLAELAAQRVTVISGPNPELVVRLPAR